MCYNYDNSGIVEFGSEFMKRFENINILFILIITLFFSFSMNVYAENDVYTFSYTGNYQEFIVPKNGYYKVELWGAQGGNWAN